MGKLWMPMNNFKKVAEDDKSATLQHPDGHQITLAKNILSDHMRQQLAALPMHKAKGGYTNYSRGGKVKRMDDGGAADPSMVGGSCGANGQAYQNGMPTGQANPTPQASGPSNPKINGGGQGAPAIDPTSQGIPGMFGGKNAMQLMNQGNREQLGGAAQAMQAQQNYAKQANPILQQSHDTLQDDLNKFWNGWQRPDGTYRPGYTQSLDEIDKVKQDILTNNINPNRFIEQGALPKVMTAIGLLGTMANSRGGGAKILDFMNQQMQRDVQAQIADKSGKVNVLQANLHQLGNMQDAIKMTTFQHMAMQSALLEQAANNTNSQMAKSVYMQTAGQIHQQMAKQVYDWTMGGVMSQKVGAQGANGVQGQQGGAQKGGQGPTDAVGNPLPQGMNINPMYYKEMNPVQMPGGQNGYGFARDAAAAGKAGAAIGSHDVLDSAIKRVQDAWGTGMAFNPFGSDLAAKKSAIDNLHAAVRQLGGPSKLTPEQRKAYEQMADLPANPGFWNKSSSQQRLQDLGNVNNDTLNAELGSDINNYVPPKQPGNSKRLVD